MRARRIRRVPECLLATGILAVGVAFGAASPQPGSAVAAAPTSFGVGSVVSSVLGGAGAGVSVTNVAGAAVADGVGGPNGAWLGRSEAGALGLGVDGQPGATGSGGPTGLRLPDLLSPTGPWAISSSLAARAFSGATAAAGAAPPAPAVPGSPTKQALSVLPSAGVRVSVPDVLWTAYARAVSQVRSSCRLPVGLLAAIGHVESRSLAGRGLTAGHDVVPAVLGPVLSGGAFAAIRDTDGGRLDGDPVWDRAVGPMQFIPGTWRVWGRDGNGDGVANPQNVDDAALAAATYLCAGGRDLSDPTQLRAAVLSYNASSSYAATVIGLMGSMTTGGTSVPRGVPAPPVTITAPPVTVTVTARPTATTPPGPPRPTVTAPPTATVTTTATVTATVTATRTLVVTETVTPSPTSTTPTATRTKPADDGDSASARISSRSATATSTRSTRPVSSRSTTPLSSLSETRVATCSPASGAQTGTTAQTSMTGTPTPPPC